MNQTKPSESITSRFATVASRFEGRIAVSAPAGDWTYAELDRRSNAIAAEVLARLGETSEPVGLLMEHDAPLIGAILGTLRANKIYLALDPANPSELLAAMLKDSGARLLLTDKAHLDIATSLATESLKVVEVTSNFQPTDRSKKFPEASPDAGAWLMYTSGSTGRPKGVWQNHSGLVEHADVYRELIEMTPDDRLSLLNSCSLSASGTTLFCALLNGATLCMFHVRSQGVERLAGWLREKRITIYHSVPTVFRHLARSAAQQKSFESVRIIRLGGEPMLRGDVETYRQLCRDDCRLMNSLSSTETGLITVFAIDQRTSLKDRRVPVGKPVSGLEVLLLDENEKPVEPGKEGRIAICGEHLRQGYWRQPEATAEKFKVDPQNPSIRTFLSNDLGRLLPDGTLDHLGRADHLVKIRGQRVDLSEVESALMATELLEEVAVTAPEDPSGERRLAAYIVPRAGTDSSALNFRKILRDQLPDQMIPSDFVMMEKLPQTPGGKLDRRALPPPARVTKTLSRPVQAPRDMVERKLGRIWEEVLGIVPISMNDDFFEVGGTSLQSVEVLLRIEGKFGITLPPSTLTEYNTIEKLALLLVENVVIPSPSPLILLHDGQGDGRPLFLIHSGQGDIVSYGLLTRRLPGRRIYGLQCVGLQGEAWPLTSVEAMAKRYLPLIQEKDPTGPYLLGGTCMGGMVALEIAQMLIKQGKEVRLLALMDAGHPRPSWEHHKLIERIYGPLRDPVRDWCRILKWAIFRILGFGKREKMQSSYRRFVTHMNAHAFRHYKPKPYPGVFSIFITVETKYPGGTDRRLMMEPYPKELKMFKIPGDRRGLFIKPAVDELARQLQIELELADVNSV